MNIIHYLSLAIGVAGIAVIAWGSIVAFFQIVLLETKRFRKKINICKELVYVRQHFGTYLLLGLEFMIAADIIRTITRPTLQELAVLGAIVAIRTVISYFLNKEMGEGHECGEEG